MQTIDGQKIEINNYKKLTSALSPWKEEMVNLFYGNDAEKVVTYHWVYQRPEQEKLEEWHAIMESTRNSSVNMSK
jgi:hypothetical protein